MEKEKIKAKVEKITSAHLLSLSARGFRILKSNFDNHDWLTSEGGIHPIYFCQKIKQTNNLGAVSENPDYVKIFLCNFIINNKKVDIIFFANFLNISLFFILLISKVDPIKAIRFLLGTFYNCFSLLYRK